MSAVGAAGPSSSVASYAQERVWLASQMARDAPLYHVTDEFTVHARVSEAQLREAFAVVTTRHESLRTSFHVSGGTLMQVGHQVIEPAVESADLRDLSTEDQRGIRAAASARLVYQPFDLARAPLWRAALLQVEDDSWAVILVAHHAVFDAESALNLHAEITELCAAAEQGREAKLPGLPLRYSSYAVSQRGRLSGPRGAEVLAFWRQRLRGLPPVHGVPLDRPRPSRRSFAGADSRAELPAATMRAVAALARTHRTVRFTVLLAAYVLLLYQRSGIGDIVVGVPAAGRGAPELRPMIGAFVNMLLIRVAASGDQDFADLVVSVRDRAAEAWEHQELPFQQAVEQFANPRVPGAAPLYQCGFNVHETRPYGSSSTTAEDELFLEVAGGSIRLEYSTALFDAATADGLLADYVRILDAAPRAPHVPVSLLLPAPQPPAGSARPDTRACRTPPGSSQRTAPRTKLEALVAGIWSQVLTAPAPGVLDDFFSLGGHSLHVLRVLAAVQARTGAQPTVQAFFADPTIAGLAAEIERITSRRTA